MKIKSLFSAVFAALMLTALSACSHNVKFELSKSYQEAKPYVIAVAPVVWDNEPDLSDKNVENAASLFRTMTFERLRRMDYGLIRLEDVDKAHSALGGAETAKPADIAKALNADAVLFIRVTSWDTSLFVTYSALKVKARFELYGKDGKELWHATYKTKESDLRLDTKPAELAVIKAYEPRVQRFIDAVFSTLPPGEPPSDRRTFFEWLP